MANFYIRVPHYVASYFMNRDLNNKLKPTDPIKFSNCEFINSVICENIFPNKHQTVVRAGCFNERQWNKMMKGYYLAVNKKNPKQHTHYIIRKIEDPLTDEEVSKLAGLAISPADNKFVYMAIRMPREVYFDGSICKPSFFWQPKKTGAERIRKALIDEFWRAMFVYVCRHREYAMIEYGQSIMLTETIERFMIRFDIRNSVDDKVLNTLYRNYHRKVKSFKFTDEEFIEYDGFNKQKDKRS